MKILVMSDSHGYAAAAEGVIAQIGAGVDAVVHLGDGYRDLAAIKERCPQIKRHAVPGNCDGFCGEPPWKLIETPAGKAFITHGHTFGVKSGLEALAAKARAEGAAICLFGHTHEALIRREADGLLLVNPGSVSFPRGRYPSYAVITTEEGGAEAALVAITPAGLVPFPFTP